MTKTDVMTAAPVTAAAPGRGWRVPPGIARLLPGAIIAAAAGLAILAALRRSFELDEGYTYLILNGQPRLTWPAGVFTRAAVAHWFAGTSSLARIAADLRTYDVHPPLWFYVEEGWRRLVGPGLLPARLLSVAFMVASLLLVARAARRCRAPVAPTLALTAFSYAVLYTGATVRMYPFANMLLLAGTLALLRALDESRRARAWRWAALAGLAFGAGTAAHLFVVFPALAVGLTAAATFLARRQIGAVVIAGVTAAPAIGWAASFYLVQPTHDWQFPPFGIASMAARTAKEYAAALFGGTPVYVPHTLMMPVAGLLGGLLLVALGVAALGGRRMAADAPGRIILAGTLAMPIALFAVAAAVGKETVELRYLIYGLPFLAMFLARGWRAQRLVPRPACAVLAAAFLTAQLIGAVAMPFAHITQQAARPAIAQISRLWQPGSILLLPEADDTSGMTLDYAYEAPAGWPLLLLRRDEDPAALRRAIAGRPRAFIILIADAAGTAAIARARATLTAAGWRSAGSPGGEETRLGRAWEEMLPPR
jgi:hypothetical protein